MKCVNCDYPMQADTEITGGDAKPSPGDYTICFGCAQPYQFNDNLEREPLTKSQFRYLPKHDQDQIREAWFQRDRLIREIKGKGIK